MFPLGKLRYICEQSIYRFTLLGQWTLAPLYEIEEATWQAEFGVTSKIATRRNANATLCRSCLTNAL